MTRGSIPGPSLLGMVWAQARGRVIGDGTGMPWHLPEDMRHFKAVTAGHPVIMGRATWESLPERFRPLPGRRNIVLTRQPGYAAAGAETVADIRSALALVRDEPEAWIMGGGTLYEQALQYADLLEVTDIDADAAGTVTAPTIDASWQRVRIDPSDGFHVAKNGLRYRFSSFTST
ncbi:dihydrofolate reductase [uncultured Agrococcus sp.]|uniref:dihydrofolate reductase n=1 Tax=uncultured Agrococcus sp. TaxID=382258 RepID=UPI0025E35F16|nr:dihydrofolate reductase [uncultured Agrococcus sp.]